MAIYPLQINAWNTNSIRVVIPAGTPTGTRNIVVTAGGIASNKVAFTINANTDPVITGISPTQGTLGTTLTITGSNFGATQVSSVVKIGTVTIPIGTTHPNYWSDSTIKCVIPTGAVDATISVTVGGVTAYSSQTFDVTTGAAPANWDTGWPTLSLSQLPYSNSGAGIGTVIYRDAGCSYYSGGDNAYGENQVWPIQSVQQFWEYYTQWMPEGGPNSTFSGGIRGSYESALMLHNALKCRLPFCSSYACYGYVSWSAEVPHGFNLVLAYDLTKDPDPIQWKLYMMDTSVSPKKIPVRLIDDTSLRIYGLFFLGNTG